MEKLAYLAWRPEAVDPAAWADQLHEVAGALAAAGTPGVQLDVHDAAVADALVAMSTFDRPIEAVLFVWVDTVAGPQRTAVEEQLGAVVERLAGYLVTESVPLAAPPSLGERTPGFANIAVLRRPAELDREAWLAAWQGRHTPVAIEVQSTFGYVQHPVVRPLTPGAPPVDAIVEELFPIEALTDLHAFFATGGDDGELGRRMGLMGESVARFGADRDLDVLATSRYVVAVPGKR